MSDRRIRWLVNACGAVAALAVQVVLWCASYGFAPRHLVGDEKRYLGEALAIWQGQPTPPQFIWPPLQQWFLAPLVGPLDGRIWLAQIVQSVLLVLAALCLRQIWLRMDPRPLAADVAFWLMLVSPAVMAFGFYLWPEPLHLCLMLGAVWLLACHGRSLLAAAAAGAAVGLALLAKSLLSGFWPLFLLLLLRRPVRRSHWRQAGAFVVAVLVVCGPFLWRGFEATGRPLVADSSVFNLYTGLTNQWRSDYIPAGMGQYMRQYQSAGDTPRERNAAFQQRIEAKLAAAGGIVPVAVERLGIQYFRLFNAKRTVLSMLPGRRCQGYIDAYTVPSHWIIAIQALTRMQYLLVLVFAAFGMLLLGYPALSWARSGKPGQGAAADTRLGLAWFMALFFGYQLALFLGLHVKARFLLPMLPFLSGFAASVAVSLLPAVWVRGRSPLAGHKIAWALGLLLAMLLLFLALGGPWLDASCVKPS